MAVSFGRLLLFVNSFLIFAALCISLLFVVSWLSPKSLRSLGNKYISVYVKSGQSRADDALVAAKEGDTETATELLERWKHFHKGDRYYAFRRDVVIGLSHALEKTDSHQEIVDITTPIMEQDERDLVIFTLWAAAAINIEEMKEAATARVVETWNRFPESETLSEFYLRDVYAWDDPAHARQLVETYGYLKPVTRAGWEVFWATEKGFRASNRKLIDFELVGAEWRATFEMPKGTQLLRIDPPAGQRLEISGFRIHRQGEETSAVGPAGHMMQMMTLNDGVLVTTGGDDPFIALNVGEMSDPQEPVVFVVTLKVKSTFASWVEKRMQEL